MVHHFFLPEIINPDKEVNLTGRNAHHAANVLRLRVGDRVTVADSSGQGYLATIRSLARDRVAITIEATVASPEPRIEVSLYQGWPKGNKLDLIIEKSTELGIARIEVLLTERSIPRPAPNALERRRQRWQQKALAAAQQSRRHFIPPVNGPSELPAALAAIRPGTLLLVPWEEEHSIGLKAVLEKATASRLAVLIGPEGGLSPAEIALIRERGGIPVTLGPRILRTETAGLACLAAIMYAFGEM
ncbi:MAG: 16S rRNA (uracil(1498)-N(3))-methyltransferase [Clostridia bacterium]|nr:16S rRNA (uracil(1498)-N(3))-methyltransferase [Clostridia bacterium]